FSMGYNTFRISSIPQPNEGHGIMPDPIDPQHCAELLGALAAPERLQIVRCLRDGPQSVTELSDRLKIKLVNVSNHLSVLRTAHLVQTRKQGRHVVYSLTPGLLQLDDQPGCCDHLNLGCCRLEMPAPPASPTSPADAGPPSE